jgi:N6-L-threonylcarbamoyladenine synthase
MEAIGRPGGLILAIESSCDETAAAVVRAGSEVRSNIVASQIALHANYGGVVPELASREHLRNIVPVVRAAMEQAGVTYADLDAIAVTEGPGLAGALLVGITYAKALALGAGKPLIAVNHLEGHIHAVLMQTAGNSQQFAENREQGAGNSAIKRVTADGPLLALVVSGGHTHLYLAQQSESPGHLHDGPIVTSGAPTPTWSYRNVGRTVDDAAGEAFDKVAKLLGLGYPGGPWMDALAKHGNPRAVEFRFQPLKTRQNKIDLAVASAAGEPTSQKRDVGHPASSPRPHSSGQSDSLTGAEPNFDFSFSGIKTAVLRYIQTHGLSAAIEARRAALAEALRDRPALRADEAMQLLPEIFDTQTLDLIASFQFAVVGNLMRQTFAAAKAFGARGVVVSGGVAANSELRQRFTAEAAQRGLPVAFPTTAMSTDNAAMIAAAAWPKFLARQFAADSLIATPQLRLG